MLNELNIVCPEDKELVRHRIELIEKETGTVLDEMQKKAITSAFLREKVQRFGWLHLPDVLQRE